MSERETERQKERKSESDRGREKGEKESEGEGSESAMEIVLFWKIRKSIWKQRNTNLHGVAQSHPHASIHTDSQTPSYEKSWTQPT